MRTFKSFNIELSPSKNFTGPKIKVTKILNREIAVLDYKIGPSIHFKGDCLNLWIEYGDTKYIIFTSGEKLIEAIEKVPKDGFPFKTTIIESDERYLFD